MRISHSERNLAQIVFHLALPVLAMGLFWFVLYESLLPFVFPLAWAAVFWALAMIPAIVYALKATRHMDTTRGHHLGIHEEDLPVGI